MDDTTSAQKKLQARLYRHTNRVAIAAQKRKYQEDNAVAIAARKLQYRLANKESIAASDRAYRQKNASAISSRKREYKKRNSAHISQHDREYRKAHRSHINAHKRQRTQTDVNFRMVNNLRRRLGNALNGHTKSASTMELLGCTARQCNAHLESQFAVGMSWDNRAEWHIDHIRPCASFDLSLPEHQRACFHYSNLQPLWARDNLSKGAKY